LPKPTKPFKALRTAFSGRETAESEKLKTKSEK
jgi:hypothetical protein